LNIHTLHWYSPEFYQECAGFINTLFTVLRTKSYMPYVAAEDSPPLQVTPLDNHDGIPIPLDGLLTPSPDTRPKKRSNPGNDGDERPHKGPRLNNDAGFSRYGDDAARSAGGWMGMHGYAGPRMGGMNPFPVPPNGRQSQGYQPPDQKRGICRDYHSSLLFDIVNYMQLTSFIFKIVVIVHGVQCASTATEMMLSCQGSFIQDPCLSYQCFLATCHSWQTQHTTPMNPVWTCARANTSAPRYYRGFNKRTEVLYTQLGDQESCP